MFFVSEWLRSVQCSIKYWNNVELKKTESDGGVGVGLGLGGDEEEGSVAQDCKVCTRAPSGACFYFERRLYLCECVWLEIDWRSRRPACCALGGTHSQRTRAACMA